MARTKTTKASPRSTGRPRKSRPKPAPLAWVAPAPVPGEPEPGPLPEPPANVRAFLDYLVERASTDALSEKSPQAPIPAQLAGGTEIDAAAVRAATVTLLDALYDWLETPYTRAAPACAGEMFVELSVLMDRYRLAIADEAERARLVLLHDALARMVACWKKSWPNSRAPSGCDQVPEYPSPAEAKALEHQARDLRELAMAFGFTASTATAKRIATFRAQARFIADHGGPVTYAAECVSTLPGAPDVRTLLDERRRARLEVHQARRPPTFALGPSEDPAERTDRRTASLAGAYMEHLYLRYVEDRAPGARLAGPRPSVGSRLRFASELDAAELVPIVQSGLRAFVSVAPIWPDGSCVADAFAQASRCFSILRESLTLADLDPEMIVRLEARVVGQDLAAVVESARREVLRTVGPAASVVPVSELFDARWRVEVRAELPGRARRA